MLGTYIAVAETVSLFLAIRDDVGDTGCKLVVHAIISSFLFYAVQRYGLFSSQCPFLSVYVRFCPFSYNKFRAKGFLRMLNYLNAKTIFENVSVIRLKRQGVV